MQGLENRPDYPKAKPWYFRPERDSLVDYNIVSNYSLADHHYDAPEKRPENVEYKVSIKQFIYISNTIYFIGKNKRKYE